MSSLYSSQVGPGPSNNKPIRAVAKLTVIRKYTCTVPMNIVTCLQNETNVTIYFSICYHCHFDEVPRVHKYPTDATVHCMNACANITSLSSIQLIVHVK